jgi:hypothetical protein
MRIFGRKREEVTRRKLHNEELQNLYPSPNIIKVMKSRRVKLAGLVARMRDMRNAYRIFVGKYERKTQFGLDGRVILKLILKK